MKHLFCPSLLGLLIILILAGNGTAQTDSTLVAQPDSLPQLTQSQARLLLLKSAVLPGWGERSLNYVERSHYFNASEIALWVTYFAFYWYGNAVTADMEAYAATHAGVNPDGKDQYYFTDIGNYENIYAYNEQKLRYRAINLLYPVTPEYYWAWDSESSRRHFDKLRVKSATALRNATFAIGGLVANRLFSMLDVIVLTRNRLEMPDIDIESNWQPYQDGMSLTLSLKF